MEILGKRILSLLLLISITFVYASPKPKGDYKSYNFQLSNLSAINKTSKMFGDEFHIIGIMKNIRKNVGWHSDLS